MRYIKPVFFSVAGVILGATLVYAVLEDDPWGQIERYRAALKTAEVHRDRKGPAYIKAKDIPPIEGALGELVDRGDVVMSIFAIPGSYSNENVRKWMSCDLFVHSFGPGRSGLTDLVFVAWYRKEDGGQVQEFVKGLRSDPGSY